MASCGNIHGSTAAPRPARAWRRRTTDDGRRTTVQRTCLARRAKSHGSKPWVRPGSPFRPWIAIRLGGLSGAASETRHPDLDERARKLLRQCGGGNVLQDHQVGADLAGRRADARSSQNAVSRYINGFYNPVRRHSSPGFKSPIAVERKAREES